MNAMLWEDVAHDPTDIQCKHTRCSWSVYSECCATHVATYFPHISVGCSFGNRWHLFSAPLLVQRLLVQKVAFSKTTLCVSFNTLPMAKPIPIRPPVQRLKRFQRYTPWTSVHRWMDLIFPPAHGPDRGKRRSTWASKHIKITSSRHLLKKYMVWMPHGATIK